MELVGSRLGLHFDRAGTVLAILCAVVGSENFEFADGVDAGSHVQRAVAAVVEVIAAIEFPVVVLDAAAVDAELSICSNADPTFVGARLVADAGNEA